MDLRVARVAEAGAALVGAPDGGGVGAPGVGREIEDVAVAAGGEDDGVGRPAAQFAGDEIAGDDALGLAADHDQVGHLLVGEEFDRALPDHAGQRGVGSEQQLLPGLAAGVERAGHLGAAEGAVGEQAAVFAGERNALGDTLVDDVDGDLGQTMHVGLARAVVAALDRVVEEPIHAVAVVLVVLGGVDAALGGDRVGAARAVMEDEALHLVAQLGQRGRGGGAREPGADHDHLVFALVGGVDELDLRLVLAPLVGKRAGRNLGIEFGHGVRAARGLMVERKSGTGGGLSAGRGRRGRPSRSAAPRSYRARV